MKRLRRIPAPVGDRSELLLRPLRNIDVSTEEYKGMHQLRIFEDITPDVHPNSGIFVLLVNQQQRGTNPLKAHHPAWYTGRLELDAIPVEFIDVDKLHTALGVAKSIQEERKKRAAEKEQEVDVEAKLNDR
jgi:hypothetical protein